MLQVEYLPPAKLDLDEAYSFIQEDSLDKANRAIIEIQNQIDFLTTSPGLGRPGHVKGVRELVLKKHPFTVFYMVESQCIVVLRVFHHSRNR